jgi:N-acetyl-anhydromuramyl-L-alanine amidase AmpD
MIEQWHLGKGYAGIGYHYIITGDGKLHTGRPATEVGAHAYGRNSDTLGICLTGNFDKEKPSDAQMKTLIQLLATLCQRHKLRTAAIIGHRDTIATSCPGANVYNKLSYIKTEVAKYL